MKLNARPDKNRARRLARCAGRVHPVVRRAVYRRSPEQPSGRAAQRSRPACGVQPPLEGDAARCGPVPRASWWTTTRAASTPVHRSWRSPLGDRHRHATRDASRRGSARRYRRARARRYRRTGRCGSRDRAARNAEWGDAGQSYSRSQSSSSSTFTCEESTEPSLSALATKSELSVVPYVFT